MNSLARACARSMCLGSAAGGGDGSGRRKAGRADWPCGAARSTVAARAIASCGLLPIAVREQMPRRRQPIAVRRSRGAPPAADRVGRRQGAAPTWLAASLHPPHARHGVEPIDWSLPSNLGQPNFGPRQDASRRDQPKFGLISKPLALAYRSFGHITYFNVPCYSKAFR